MGDTRTLLILVIKQPKVAYHPPTEAGATGGTTKAQAIGGRVQRLVVPMLRSDVSVFPE
jgi:hypothetical protein